MDCAPRYAVVVAEWLAHLMGDAQASPIKRERCAHGLDLPSALAALAAEALARAKTLRIVTDGDDLLPEISQALDWRLRPLCLILPGEDFAARVTLRATLALVESRSLRAGMETVGPAWENWRRHIACAPERWHAALEWKSRARLLEPPPQETVALFPIQIGSMTAFPNAPPLDWVVTLDGNEAPWFASHARVINLLPPTTHERRWVSPIGSAQALEFELASQQLAEMELELASAESELSAFAQRYQALIAPRQRLLERLRVQRRAEAQTERAQTPGCENGQKGNDAFFREPPSLSPLASSESSLALKKRFRMIAQKIHPDRARSDAERAWRTNLMAEANRAYRHGDAHALEAVFDRFLRGYGEHAESSLRGERYSLTQRLAAVRRRLREIERKLDRIYGSKLYELLVAARQAARAGRDLLAEIASRLDAEIALLRRSGTSAS
ncbi:MAG: J domain-containing protein [Rhodocyclaceae bacterium]|nr:J domain-containing protein [Rhodocyclaceae bacterium]